MRLQRRNGGLRERKQNAANSVLYGVGILLLIPGGHCTLVAATPDTQPTTQTVSKIPVLPADVEVTVKQQEAAADDAWNHPMDRELAKRSLPLAEAALKTRQKYQGDNWWKTQDDRIRVVEMQELLQLTDKGRKSLAQAHSLFIDAARANDQPALSISKSHQALKLYRTVFKEDQPGMAKSLSEVADNLRSIGHIQDAFLMYQEALAMDRRLFKGDHPDVEVSLNNLACCLGSLGRTKDALPMLREALAMDRRMFEGESTYVVHNLSNQAHCLELLGRSSEALPIFQEALAVDQRLDKGDSRDVAHNLNDVAECLDILGHSEDALPIYREALEMRRRLFKGDDPDVAATLNSIALSLQSLGWSEDALSKFQEAVAMNRRVFKGDDPDLAGSLSNLAQCLESVGRSEDALPLFQEALAMDRRMFSGDHPDVAGQLNNLAVCIESLGHSEDALPKYREAMEMRRRLFEGDHPDVAASLSNVASCLQSLGGGGEALPMCREALEMRRRLYDGDHPEVAGSMNNLASCLESAGRNRDAYLMYHESLSMEQRLFKGMNNPDLASSLSNLGLCSASLGIWPEAVQNLDEGESMKWRIATRIFPRFTDGQKRAFLDQLRFIEGDFMVTLSSCGHADASAGFAGMLSEKQLLSEVTRQEQIAFFSSIGAASPGWKSLWHQRQQLRQQYAILALSSIYESHKSTGFDGKRHSVDPTLMNSISNRLEALEAQLRQTNSGYAVQARLSLITVAELQRALPDDAALVEHFLYHPYDFANRTSSDSRYACFVVSNGKVTLTDLGPAKTIDDAVLAYREAMKAWISLYGSQGGVVGPQKTCQSEVELARLSEVVRHLVWEPIARQLVSSHRVYIAPDGQLSLFPFEALAQLNGDTCRYLGEDKELVYMNTGRDLARLAITVGQDANRPKTAVLVGNPDFNAPSQALVAGLSKLEVVDDNQQAGVVPTTEPAEASAISMAVDRTASGGSATLGGGDHRQIPRNFRQIASLAKLVDDASNELKDSGWSVTALKDQQASEEAVLALEAPTILQFATHGYMLDRPASDVGWDNPLLHSMLILAGANKWQKDSATFYPAAKGEWIAANQARKQGLDKGQGVTLGDGLLTAYMVTGMNLHGTQLVNLTACDTGMGEVTPQGVASLRQAFLLAGARSVTASMWEVPADETPEQMRDFYHRWLGDKRHPAENRFEAFHEAQLAALAKTRQNRSCGHPFFWAGVVYVGDPGDLEHIDFDLNKSPTTQANQP